MNGIDYLVSTFGGAFAVLLFFTLILWAFLPFSVFGIKKRLDRMTARQRRTNELLEYIAQRLDDRQEPPPNN
jgi:hypothetical protein